MVLFAIIIINDYVVKSYYTLSLVDFGIESVTLLQFDNAARPSTRILATLSTVHLSRSKLWFGHRFNVLGRLFRNLIFPAWFVWEGRFELCSVRGGNVQVV